MQVRPCFFALITAFFALFALNAAAKSIAVTVAERGADAAEARAKAMIEAEQKAFRLLVQESAPEEKVDAIIGAYDEAHISQMVQGYEVEEETITDTSYHAKLLINFDDALVQQLLKPDTGWQPQAPTQPKSALETEAVLVLPVYRDDSGIMLWEKENKWRDVLNRVALAEGFERLVMPLGDPTDRLMIDAGNVTSASYAMLAGLANRYGARDVMVVVAEPEYGSTPQAINTHIKVLSPHGTEKHHFRIAAKTLDTVMQRSAEKVVLGLSEVAPAAKTGKQAPLINMHAVVKLSHVRDWVEIRKRLEQIAEIETIDIMAADWQQMVLTLSYRGEPEMLGHQLTAADIAAENMDGVLKLALQ